MRRRRILAGKAIAGADKRNRAGNDGAEKRQEDDGLVHYRCPSVMPALVAGIHVLTHSQRNEGMDGRDKPGHDERIVMRPERVTP